ncbi:MAG: twin-arginine translocation signal domain-containing protein [Polyangiaceae bacterium]
MDRRDFLKAGAIAGGSVGMGALGCGAVLEGVSAVQVPSVAELMALDVDGFLKNLDTSLGFLRSSSSLDSLVSRNVQMAAKKDPRFEKSEDLVRKTMRSLLLVGSFGDLSEAGRVHPGVQSRMWSSLGEMDEAMTGMNRTLTSFTPTERADIGRLMREDPAAGPRILDALDDEAVKAGVTETRRTHLREVGKHACFRLRQSTSLFIDEYDGKVQKVAARDATVQSFQRRLMAQMGEKAFWEYHARQMALAQAWQHVPGVAQSAGPSPTGTFAQPTGTFAPPPGTVSPQDPSAAPGYPLPTAQPMATGTTVVYPYLAPTGAAPYPTVGPYGEPTTDENGRDLGKLRTGNILLGVGGGLMGLAAIAGIVGGVMVGGGGGAGFAGLFVLTAGAVLGLGGIACLIAGGIIRARA